MGRDAYDWEGGTIFNRAPIVGFSSSIGEGFVTPTFLTLHPSYENSV